MNYQNQTFKKSEVIKSILSHAQRVSFKERFGDFMEMKLIINGLQKNVFLTEDKAILFYKNQGYDLSKNEIKALEWFGKEGKTPYLPYLIEKIEDKTLSDFPVLIVNKLEGAPLFSLWDKLSDEDLKDVFSDLGSKLATLHETHLKHPSELIETPVDDRWDPYNWTDYLSEKKHFDKAIDFAFKHISPLINLSPNSKDTWRKTLLPFTNIKTVLIHCDIHEEQILVQKNAEGKYEVSGIPDWGFAQICTPLQDFYFNEERGFPSKEVFLPKVKMCRKSMWENYTQKRGLDIPYASLALLFDIYAVLFSDKFKKQRKPAWDQFLTDAQNNIGKQQ